MSVTSIDDIVSGLTSSRQDLLFHKVMTSPKTSGAFASSWLAPGMPGAGSTPPAYTAGSGYTCDKSTPGAIPFNNATLSNLIAKLTASSSLQGTFILVDRLWSCSGIPFGAGTYTITTPGSLPARITDGGVGVEAWVENFVAAGAGGGTLTLNYLDTTGAAGAGTIAATHASPVVGQVQHIPLDVGDLGISRVVSVAKPTSWTSGSFGLTLVKRLFELPINQPGLAAIADWSLTGLVNVPDDACLSLFWVATSTTAPVLMGNITLIDK